MLVNEQNTIIAGTPHYCIKNQNSYKMKVHSCHLHRDFYNSICAMVGVYSLTGSGIFIIVSVPWLECIV